MGHDPALGVPAAGRSGGAGVDAPGVDALLVQGAVGVGLAVGAAAPAGGAEALESLDAKAYGLVLAHLRLQTINKCS